MNLLKLLKNIKVLLLQGSLNQEMNEIRIDSRKVSQNDLFICIKGARSDGHQYIKKAVSQGATAILVEHLDEDLSEFKNITILQVDDSRKALALIAANRYNHPQNKLKIIGITGTKGKTTTAHMITEILNQAGFKAGYIGTNGISYGLVKEKSDNTTPEPLKLHYTFRQMVDNGCTHVVMEASSQGFKQFRTHGLIFEYGLFLNIDYDHVGPNEHQDFDEYFNCKRMIFNQSRQMIINKSLPLWEKLAVHEKERAITFSTNSPADYFSQNYEITRSDNALGGRFELAGKIRESILLKQMLGVFNSENALAAIATCSQMGIDIQTIKSALKNFEVEGRTQLVKEALKYDRTVLIDYAHNSMSMLSLLKALKAYEPRRIICVFGTREDRPEHRRFDIGYAASKYANEIILTEDNPGSLEFEAVISEAVRGIATNNFSALKTIRDRKTAILYALEHATKEDIIVITGKGHEHYQITDGQPNYFSEEKIILEHLKRKNVKRAVLKCLPKNSSKTALRITSSS
ncbi:UDP-N-acetylmuramoyl-L-alanyl-D-glutamate--2,6-diaminopimelate ligase [Eubacteriaceae bacterium ES3]|nr:UDP-N-acetylmuramoyl-L-alanyl-D-glutamate--2,6-diaminopimelate ligase [Eubacteriaceae bacterium ES3]